MNEPLDLTRFFRLFPDEASCRKYLETIIWKDGEPICPHCGNKQKIYRYKNNRTFKCASCNRQFQVTTNTVYEGSNLPLQKWFLAFYLISSYKKGISSVQLAKSLGITQKSAWFLAHKIRHMLSTDENKPLKKTVECDETYVGGRKKGKRGRGSENKTPVFGMLQRKGRLIIMPVEDTKRKTLEPLIYKNVKKGSHIMTDEWHAYKKLYLNYKHEVVTHGRKEYARGMVHVNTLEGAWSLLKRSFKGTYHRPSKKYLDKYCAEFQFKYNTQKETEYSRFNRAITKSNRRVKNAEVSTRLTY